MDDEKIKNMDIHQVIKELDKINKKLDKLAKYSEHNRKIFDIDRLYLVSDEDNSNTKLIRLAGSPNK